MATPKGGGPAKKGEETIEADTVILALGLKAEQGLYNELAAAGLLSLGFMIHLPPPNVNRAKGGERLNTLFMPAQEESLAASGGLYPTLLPHTEYYRRNRACGTMMYTGCADMGKAVLIVRLRQQLLPPPGHLLGRPAEHPAAVGETLERIVRENSKQRYSLSPDGKKIRANQGHSPFLLPLPIRLFYRKYSAGL